MINQLNVTKLNKHLYWCFIVVTTLFFLGDVGRKTGLFFDTDFIRYTAIAKGLGLFVYTFIFTLFFRTYFSVKTLKLLSLVLVGLIVLFIVGQALMIDSRPLHIRVSKNLVYLSRVFFMPVTFLVFYPILKDKVFIKKMFRFLELVFLMYILSILSGVLFEIVAFKTYMFSDRFGYMGLFNSNNQASFFCMFMLSVYYHRAFFLNNSWVKLGVVTIVALLIGTKKMYLFLGLLAIFDLLYFKRYINKAYLIGFGLIITTAFIFHKTIISFLQDRFFILYKVYEDNGMLTSLSSLRNVGLQDTITNIVLPKWTFSNYIIGGSQFYNNRPEMELVDIYMFLGIFGLFFFSWFVYLLLTYFESSFYMKFALISYIIITAIAAGFFISANQPLPFLVTFAMLRFQHLDKQASISRPPKIDTTTLQTSLL